MGGRIVAIIGDNFVTPGSVRRHLEALGEPFTFREMCHPWPDEPMRLVADREDLRGLREYMGGPEEVLRLAEGAEILVNHLSPLSAAMARDLPGLGLVVVTRGGPVNVDSAGIRAAGPGAPRLVHTPGRNASAVAEFTVGLVLSETRLIRLGHEELRAGRWRGDLYREDRAGRELCELTVGIVGYGQVGSRVVSLLLPFGARVLVHDPFKPLSASHADAGAVASDLDPLLAESDVVSLHSRLQPGEGNRFGREFFSRMRPGVLFVNTARGVMVDYDDLHGALADGTLGAAALDTYANEPPAGSPILGLPNVTLTPHLAGSSRNTVRVTARAAAEEVRRYLAGEDPLNPIP